MFHRLRPLVIPESLVKIGPVVSEIWVVTDNRQTDRQTEAPSLFDDLK